MITRRSVLLAGGIGLLAAHRLSHGQPAATIRRVGVLWFASEAASTVPRVAFTQGMQDLGWLEGKNVEYRFVHANGDVDRMDTLASELIGQKVEVDEVLGKLIGILHEVAPGARRIAILLNESSALHAAYWAGAQSACAALGLEALRVVASAPAEFGAAVEQIVRQRSQAVVVAQDFLYFGERAKLQALMQTTRLPTAYGLREHVAAGGLLSYGPDIAAAYRHAAKYVDKILKGTKPADLPVEQPNKFELAINLKTAKALGITIPKDMLLRADEVIQ